MKKQKRDKNSLIFILSILLHTWLALFVIVSSLKNKKSHNNILTEKKRNEEILAALKPRKSNFGTTVIFDDIPQFTKPKSEIMAKEESHKEHDIQIEQKPVKPSIELKDITDLQDQKEILAKTTITKPLPNSKQEKLVKEIKAKQDEVKSIEVMRTFGTQKEKKAPKPPRRKSILQMTQGFLQNNKDEGRDWIKRDGDENKMPDFEDLKKISYNTKIHWQAQQEDRILNAHMPFQKRRQLFAGYKTEPVIMLVINEDGTLKNLELIKNSGSALYDKHCLKIFKKAAPYPPIPKHFKEKPYTITLRIVNS